MSKNYFYYKNMSLPSYQQNGSSCYKNLFSELDVAGDVYCNTLHYTALDPPASGTTKWGANGSDIYNLNVGNVGIGTTTPAQKLSVNGNITSTGNITCNTLNYTTLNPPIPGANSKWFNDLFTAGIYRNTSVGINTSGALNTHSLWVNGDAKIQTNLSVNSLTDVTQINTEPFANYADVYTAVFNGFWTNTYNSIVHVHRVGNICSMSMEGQIHTDNYANAIITANNVISRSKYFPHYNIGKTNRFYIPINIIKNGNFGYFDQARMGTLRFVPGVGDTMDIQIGVGSEINNWGSSATGSQNGFYSMSISWDIYYGF